MAKAKKAKPAKKAAKRPASSAKHAKASAKAKAVKRPAARIAKATPKKKAAPSGSKASAKKIVAKKAMAPARGSRAGSKIAIGASMLAAGAAGAVALRAAKLGKDGKGGTTPQNKKLVMPSNKNGTPKEVAPGGGIVQPATKSAPAMRLRADDAEILATAKERYGRKDLEIFRKLLTEQQQEAREEFDILSQNILDTSGEFEADNQTYSLHTAEQGTDAIEREKTFLHAQRTSDYIKKLEEALERIDRGTYGICVVCGGLIEKQRLAAVPITQKHVDCKNRTQPRKVGNGSGFHDMEEQPVNAD